ncbi:MAG: efflux RND transporter periplasmic adaptor subunit, partial [Rikenellaceae bacterium]
MKKILVLLLSFAVVSCGGATKKADATTDVEVGVLTKVAEATAGEVILTELFTSEVQPYKENEITPASSGVRVERILVEVGDNVKKGQLLATLDPTTYKQQLTNLNNLEADYARYESVYKAGGLSKQSLDQAKTGLDIQREVVDNLKKNIEVLSPITGVVTARYTEVGNLFMSQPILNIMQINRLKVNVSIPEEFFPNVKIGMEVDVLFEIYPGESFTGKVSLISPTVEQSTRTFAVEITLPNGDDKLRPGMYAKSQFVMGSKSAVYIPDIAIQKQIGTADDYVYVVDGDNVA